jgi:hypothetical protein
MLYNVIKIHILSTTRLHSKRASRVYFEQRARAACAWDAISGWDVVSGRTALVSDLILMRLIDKQLANHIELLYTVTYYIELGNYFCYFQAVEDILRKLLSLKRTKVRDLFDICFHN